MSQSRPSPSESPPEEHKTAVLVVDDSPEIRVSTEAMLTRPDRTVVTAESGEAALELLDEHEYALALLDVQLPGMDGFEVAEKIRAHPPTHHLPIIFVSGLRRETRHVFQGYEAGAVDYLMRPVDPQVLVSKVDVFCRMHVQQLRIARYVATIEAKNAELEKHLAEIKTLRGLIPICANCKKVRDDDGYWQRVEVYIMDRSDARFTHGICQDCMDDLYGKDL